jgi:nucleotide-binding universal stress UspA family protein
VKRREFITLLGGATAAWPLAAPAQQAERMRRIGVLMPLAEEDQEARTLVTTFVKGLQEHGWRIGRDVSIDYRWAAGDPRRIERFAKELVEQDSDLILARSRRPTKISIQQIIKGTCEPRLGPRSPLRSPWRGSYFGIGSGRSAPGWGWISLIDLEPRSRRGFFSSARVRSDYLHDPHNLAPHSGAFNPHECFNQP